MIRCVLWHSAVSDLGLRNLHISHNMHARLIWDKHMSSQALYNEDVQWETIDVNQTRHTDSHISSMLSFLINQVKRPSNDYFEFIN